MRKLLTAKLIGRVWATRKTESLSGFKLMRAEIIGGNRAGEELVVVDIISAGIGERVLIKQVHQRDVCSVMTASL